MADIDVTIKNTIAFVTLNRPATRNAMTLSMWQSIAVIFRDLDQRDEVRAIILSGSGGNFSVGADISEFSKVRSDLQQSVAYEVAVDAACDAIAGVKKPVIAVLKGYCLGGGCHLAMPCDFRFVSTDVSIGIPAAKLSIVYGIRSTQRLLSLVGITNAKRILYAAERFGAEEAVKMGFAGRVCSDPIAEAMVFAENMSSLAPLSISGAKLILNSIAMGVGNLDDKAAQECIDLASSSEDYEEGRAAFIEKRPPKFKGR